jgi:hypothetical protein
MIADLCDVSPDDNRIICHFDYPPAEAFSTLHLNAWYNLPHKYPTTNREHLLTTVIEQLELHGEYRPGEFYLKSNWHMLEQVFRKHGCVSTQWSWRHLSYREKNKVVQATTNSSDVSVPQWDWKKQCQWSIRIIDPVQNDVAVHQIAALLTRSTDEYKESRGGHVPDWVVRDIIHRRYTSVEAVQRTFASTGVRFALVGKNRENNQEDVFATILVARHLDVIFIKDSQNLNVPLSSCSVEMPPGYHHCINFATNRAYRRNGFGLTLLQHIIDHASDYGLQGHGLCIRVDPPLIPVFTRLHGNFVHRYQYDQFFPATGVQLPAGCPNPWFFNQQFICPCHREQLLETMNISTTVPATSFSHAAVTDVCDSSAIASSNDCAGNSLLDIYRRLLLTRKYKYAVFTLDFPAPAPLMSV